MNNTFCKNCHRIPSQCCCTLTRTLTDEEIKGVMALNECWIGEDCSMPNMIAFARAILRKAQE
jgi:hypothetical protein